MMENFVGWMLTAAIAALAFVQWWAEWRRAGRWREEDAHVRARTRDVEFTHWGWKVIDLMTELEAKAVPIVGDLDRVSLEELAQRASALTDHGRLFFPNVSEGNTASRGYRVTVLDEVLRAHYVARFLAENGAGEWASQLRPQVSAARRRFTDLLQKEIEPTLKRVGQSHGGDSIPKDPRLWASPSDSEAFRRADRAPAALL